MAYSYKGSISFGLVYIPITLQKAVREQNVSFNMLDRKTMSRVKYIKTCTDCDDKTVKQEDIVKGYEYEDNKYVIFEDADFEKIKTQKDKNITIESFVDIAEIDPLYYDTPYYVVPQGGDKAFALLAKTMEAAGKAGIAKTVLGTKETLIALRAKNGELLLNTLFFNDEIVNNPAKTVNAELTQKEQAMANMLIESMTGEFKPEEYKNEYRERLEQAITDKINGKEIAAPKEKKGKILNLMEALEASLKKNPQKPADIMSAAAKKAEPKEVTGDSVDKGASVKPRAQLQKKAK